MKLCSEIIEFEDGIIAAYNKQEYTVISGKINKDASNANWKAPVPNACSIKNKTDISIKGNSLNSMQKMISEETQIENIKFKYRLSRQKLHHFKVILKKWRTPNGHDYTIHE